MSVDPVSWGPEIRQKNTLTQDAQLWPCPRPRQKPPPGSRLPLKPFGGVPRPPPAVTPSLAARRAHSRVVPIPSEARSPVPGTAPRRLLLSRGVGPREERLQCPARRAAGDGRVSPGRPTQRGRSWPGPPGASASAGSHAAAEATRGPTPCSLAA